MQTEKSVDYQRYVQIAGQAAEHVKAGEHTKALAIFKALVESDISDLDKANMCYNIAIVLDEMNNVTDALAWYDQGIAYERPYSRFFVTEHKAAYLARHGRLLESLRLYEALLIQPYLEESDKDRVRTNIGILREQAAS